MTLLWLPLVSLMVRIVMAVLPDHPRRPRRPRNPVAETPFAPDTAAA